MSKVRNLPEIITLEDDDLLYAVDESVGTNGGRKIKKSNLKASVAQSAAEIKTAYESNPDTNAFTDAEKTKLAGVEAGAAFQDASEVPYDNTFSGLSATEVKSALDEINTKAQADFIPSIVSGRILHYSGGTARFDDAFYQLVAGDILLNANITNGEVYVDLDGFVKQTASGVTAPALSIVFAKFSTDLNDIISLTDLRVKNAQNVVRGSLSDVRDVRAGAAASAGSSGRLSDAMHKHNILTDVPVTQTPDQTNAEGVSVSLARADHVHNIPAAAPTTNLNPASTNSEGVGTSFARNDHSHALDMAQAGDLSTVNAGDTENLGSVDRLVRADHQHPVSTSAATSLDADSTNTEGVSVSLARADHTHDLATGIPSTQNPDQSNSEGSSPNLARADHIHNIPAAAPTINLSPATTNAEGVGTSFARNDHTHALSMAQAGDLSTINAGDAESLGSVDRLVRADHQHPVSTAAATTLNANSTNTEGVSTALSRADHTHDLDTGAPSTQNPDQANNEGTSTNLARADHIHNIPADAPTTTLSPATSNSEGIGTSFARNDHTHAVATGLVGDLTTIQPDDAAAAGTVDRFARADHRHAIVASAPTTTLSPATTNAEGVGTAFSRNDHTHAIATGVVGNITTIQPDDAAAAGTQDSFARSDHRHAIVAAAPSNTGTANSEGSSTSFARADHIHDTTIAYSTASATASDTTTSVTDTLIASMTITPAAGVWDVNFRGSTLNSGNGAERNYFSVYVGGVQVAASEIRVGIAGGAVVPIATGGIVTVNGSQAIQIRWRVAAGTGTVYQRAMSVRRLSS